MRSPRCSTGLSCMRHNAVEASGEVVACGNAPHHSGFVWWGPVSSSPLNCTVIEGTQTIRWGASSNAGLVSFTATIDAGSVDCETLQNDVAGTLIECLIEPPESGAEVGLGISATDSVGTVTRTYSVRAARMDYVALGDSFSAGEGTYLNADGDFIGFMSAPTEDERVQCDRSALAYWNILDPSLVPEVTAAPVCAGAKTQDIVGSSTLSDSYLEGLGLETGDQ